MSEGEIMAIESLSAELATAQSRIRELEEERDAKRTPMTPFPLAFVHPEGDVYLEIMWHQVTTEDEYKQIKRKHLEESRERLLRWKKSELS